MNEGKKKRKKKRPGKRRIVGKSCSSRLLLKFNWSPQLLRHPDLLEQSETRSNIQVLYRDQHKDRSIPIP